MLYYVWLMKFKAVTHLPNYSWVYSNLYSILFKYSFFYKYVISKFINVVAENEGIPGYFPEVLSVIYSVLFNVGWMCLLLVMFS